MKKDWNEFVNEKMKQKNLRQEDIASDLGKTQGTVGHWLTKRRSANFDDVAKILNIIGADKVILNSDGSLEELDSQFIGLPRNGFVEVIGEAVMGSDGCFEMEQTHIGYIQIHSPDPDAYCLKVKGTSMEPRIYSGEFVLIEPNTEYSNGDEVFIRTIDGRNMIKIFNYYKDGEYRFSSINQEYVPFTLEDSQILQIEYVAGILKRSRFVDTI